MGSMSLSAWPPLRGDSVIWRPRMDCPTPQLRSQGPGKWMATWKLRFSFLWNLLKFLGTVHLFKFLGGTTDELRSCFRKISEVKIEHLWKHQKNVRYQNIEGPQMAGTFFGSRVENSFCWITTSRSDGSDDNDHDDGARIRKGWWLNSSLFWPFSCWA